MPESVRPGNIIQSTANCLPLSLFICSRMIPFHHPMSLFSTSPTCPHELKLTSNFLYYLGSQESKLSTLQVNISEENEVRRIDNKSEEAQKSRAKMWTFCGCCW